MGIGRQPAPRQVIQPLTDANARLARGDFPDFNDPNKARRRPGSARISSCWTSACPISTATRSPGASGRDSAAPARGWSRFPAGGATKTRRTTEAGIDAYLTTPVSPEALSRLVADDCAAPSRH